LVGAIGFVRSDDEFDFDVWESTPVAEEAMGMAVLMAWVFGLGFFVLIALGILLYVYFAMAYMKLAQKIGYAKPWLAWIPVANIFLYPILAGQHWAMGFLMFVPLVNVIYIFIWHWKIFEKVGRPGWWILLNLIPLLGALIFIALLGVAAWGGNNSIVQNPVVQTSPQVNPILPQTRV